MLYIFFRRLKESGHVFLGRNAVLAEEQVPDKYRMVSIMGHHQCKSTYDALVLGSWEQL